ncbi:hypothetical protein Syn7803C16_52 [Synechococcus phage ACG-2014f]|uniref:Uncharacterized protein n=1 Tax=Synechococcus phage ACG-2014f TaxID=1493511 RepID=A0A0E3I7S5_9CAUD|nr:hypothetical protein Syn7803C16_52 [Synechococcus phage ACG-2014f]AIX43691.1 hypothetical protein Syn7803C24_52 [Synechococcus phage ACG-2014f]
MNIYMVTTTEGKVFGVGQTKRSYDERHRDGDWAKFHNYLKATGGEMVLVHWWEDVPVVDTDIHKFLKKQAGIRKYAEWFSYKGNLDIIENLIQNEFFSDYQDQRIALNLKPYQREFVAKAQAEYLEFLLAAKCRAGKSVMVLSHIVDKGHKVSLIVSRFTSPSQSWVTDTKTFDRFEGLVTINLKDKDWEDQLNHWLDTDKQIVLWSTVQGVIRKISKLPSVDLLVFDEAHIGDKAKQFTTLRESMGDTPCLKVSGTAYDQLWDTTEENRFVYDYWQEQIDVQKGIIERPRMSVVLAKYESDKYSELYGSDPDAMKNLFLVDGDEFVDEYLVKEFISKYFDNNRSIKPKDRLLYNSNHIYMTLPSVKACHLFKELLDSIIPTKVVTGDTGSDSDDIDKFVKEHNRSVCLTYSANVLGTTQSLWDTVINCREGKSVQFWTQFAFRAGSGDHNWRVIDFVPSRALESLRETFCLANDLDPTLSEYEFTDFVPIHEWNEKFETLSVDQVNDILAANIGSISSLMSGGTESIDVQSLSSVEFGFFQEYNKEYTKSTTINEHDNNGGSAKQLVSEKKKGEKTEIQQKINTIKFILSLIPEVIVRERSNGNNVNTIQDVIDAETYQLITGDDTLLSDLIESGILSSASLTRRVNMTRISVDSSLKQQELTQVLSTLQVATGVQQSVPVGVFDDMILA